MSKTFFCVSRRRYLREANMHRHQREPELAAREHHAPVARASDLRHHLAMPGKMMPGAIPPLLADGRGHQRIDVAIASHTRASFDVAKRCVAAFDTRLAGLPRLRRKLRQRQHRQVRREGSASPGMPFDQRAAHLRCDSSGVPHSCRGRRLRRIPAHRRAFANDATDFSMTSGPMPAGIAHADREERRLPLSVA